MRLWLPRPIWRAIQLAKRIAGFTLAMTVMGAVEPREVLRIAAAALTAIAAAM